MGRLHWQCQWIGRLKCDGIASVPRSRWHILSYALSNWHDQNRIGCCVWAQLLVILLVWSHGALRTLSACLTAARDFWTVQNKGITINLWEPVFTTCITSIVRPVKGILTADLSIVPSVSVLWGPGKCFGRSNLNICTKSWKKSCLSSNI